MERIKRLQQERGKMSPIRSDEETVNLESFGIYKRYEKSTFENIEKVIPAQHRNAFNECRDYAENFAEHKKKGIGMILKGPVGTGKTSLAVAILQKVIRSRGGDFHYADEEIRAMEEDIRIARGEGADGVVVGALRTDGTIDEAAVARFVKAADGMAVTFHRAFDMCRNPKEALEQIIELGCTRILTSGLEANAVTGIPMLKELVEQADGRIIIMPGCGVNPSNILQIAEETGATEFHFSGRSSYESGMIYRNPKVSMGGTVKIEEYEKDVTNPEIVKAALAELAIKDAKDEAQEKKEKEARKKQQTIELKEVQLSCRIDTHDFETKARNAVRFLTAGNKVRVVVRFKGREMSHQEKGAEVLGQFEEACAEFGMVEKRPVLDGRFMSMVVVPVKNKQFVHKRPKRSYDNKRY